MDTFWELCFSAAIVKITNTTHEIFHANALACGSALC